MRVHLMDSAVLFLMFLIRRQHRDAGFGCSLPLGMKFDKSSN